MDPFATLGIERRFDVDLTALEKRHRELSRAFHPDKHAGGMPSEKRAALARAADVNEAWRVVRDPVRRAEALFALAGIPVGEDREPKAAPAFLMEMMEQREALAEAQGAGDRDLVARLAEAIHARARETQTILTRVFAEPGEDLAPHLHRLGELRFYARFLDEVSAIEDLLDDSAGRETRP